AGPVLAVEQADPGGQHTGGQQPVVAGFAEGAGAVEGADPAEVAGGSADQQRGDEQQPRDGLERGDELCDAHTARGGCGRHGVNAFPNPVWSLSVYAFDGNTARTPHTLPGGRGS